MKLLNTLLLIALFKLFAVAAQRPAGAATLPRRVRAMVVGALLALARTAGFA